MKTDFLNRNVNEGFSGGERKRNEILQLAVRLFFFLLSCAVSALLFFILIGYVVSVYVPSDIQYVICLFIIVIVFIKKKQISLK